MKTDDNDHEQEENRMDNIIFAKYDMDSGFIQAWTEDCNLILIDCDAVYHRLLQSSLEMLTELSEAFPGTVREGVLDRPMLASRVFSDAEALQKLNAITHRHVCRAVEAMLLEHAMNPRSKYNSMRKGEANVLMSKADAEAFKRSAEKAKKAYEAKYGAIPKA